LKPGIETDTPANGNPETLSLNQRLFVIIFYENRRNPILMLSLAGCYGGDCSSDGLSYKSIV